MADFYVSIVLEGNMVSLQRKYYLQLLGAPSKLSSTS